MQIKDLPSSGSLAATDVLAKDASGGTTEKINGSDLASSVKTLGSLLGTSDVVNNLTSNDPTKVASQAEAYALNQKLTLKTDATIVVANTNSMSVNSSSYVRYLDLGNNLVIVFINAIIKYTSARNARLAAFRVVIDGKYVDPIAPQMLTGQTENSTTTYENVYNLTENGVAWWYNPVAVNSGNMYLYANGVFVAQLVAH